MGRFIRILIVSLYSAVQLFTWILLLVLSTLTLVRAQPATKPASLPCRTKPLPLFQRKALEVAMAQAVQLRQANGQPIAPLTYVPIRPHVLRRANGTGGYSLASLNNVLALTNNYYRSAGIQFFFSGDSPDYVDDDKLYSAFAIGISENAVATRNATNALNQYYVQAFDGDNTGGYAYYPANNVASTQSFIRVGDDDDLGNRLIPHELGHNFNLLHTFDAEAGYETVAGDNCIRAGDLVCDTPADPYGRPDLPDAAISCVTGCPSTYKCTIVEPGTGAHYHPSPTNIMSYYFPCTHDLTAGQYERMANGLVLRQSHTAYSLNAASTPVNPVTNLSATMVNARVVLNWTDNATNEMGYFIERSVTSDSTGFTFAGGVAPDATSFTDLNAPSAATVYYRIRPSNSTGNLSQVLIFHTPFCQPVYAYGCRDYATGLGSVRFDGQVLSQNSGCSGSGVGQFTTVAPPVVPGTHHAFTITLLNQVNAMRLTVWADVNRNGSFGDPGEQIYQTPTSTTAVITAGITIPANATSGRLPVRIIALAGSSANPADPCGNYNYGEAEDYQLTVLPCVLKTVRNGNWNDPAVWSCGRVPTSREAITIQHIITIPAAVSANAVAQAQRISLVAGGQLVYASGGLLRLN